MADLSHAVEAAAHGPDLVQMPEDRGALAQRALAAVAMVVVGVREAMSFKSPQKPPQKSPQTVA